MARNCSLRGLCYSNGQRLDEDSNKTAISGGNNDKQRLILSLTGFLDVNLLSRS